MTVTSFAAAQLLRVLPRAKITRAVGQLCDVPLPESLSSAVVRLYVRAYGVDLHEAEARSKPYPSFDAFFTRPLREGMRPLAAEPRAIISPADGRVASAGPIDGDGRLMAKGQPYRVEDLVGDRADAARYEGGNFAVVYLSPRDYHRVHAPVAGKISLVRSMAGDYFPVNSIGERHVPGLFAKNRRVAIVIDSEEHGRVTVVMVGAIVVGRITVTAVPGRDVPLGNHRVDPALHVERGGEIGMFHLGSTAIVFVERGRCATWSTTARPILLGEALGGPIHTSTQAFGSEISGT